MITEQIYGKEVFAFIDGILVACSNSVSVKATRKEIATTCVGSGDTEQATTGKAKYTFTMEVAWRQTTGSDIATNVTAYEFWTKFMANTEIEFEIKPSGATFDEDVIIMATGFIKDIDANGTMDEQGKMSISGFFNDFDIIRIDEP